ncbi:CDP-alcohol phosphatidyltransferase family protein [Halomonas sp. V046]|uniref:CDP-alcohol phosphatidyltransferase family protein n=1 Tax=Halomonas sp. V046 TaxID=3459611 RepID=UPI0040449CFC
MAHPPPSRVGVHHLAPTVWAELGVGLILTVIWATLLAGWLDSHPLAGLALLGYAVIGIGFVIRWPRRRHRLGWANRITLLRGTLIANLLALCATLSLDDSPTAAVLWGMPAIAAIALVLDGLDGWIARHTHSASRFGARFDMELDALLILVLCLALTAMDKIGPWVLAIGLMRYAFVLAGLRWGWLQATLPVSQRRKAICVVQVAALLTGLMPIVEPALAAAAALVALLLLALSFALDVQWLARHRDTPRTP